MKELSKEVALELFDDIESTLDGSVAMRSVVGNYYQYWNDEFGSDFESTQEAIEWVQKEGSDLFECGNCGWYALDPMWAHNIEEDVCSECEQTLIEEEEDDDW